MSLPSSERQEVTSVGKDVENRKPLCIVGGNIHLWLIKLKRGKGIGTPLQYSCLENPMDGGAWWAAVHGVTESDATEAVCHAHAC